MWFGVDLVWLCIVVVDLRLLLLLLVLLSLLVCFRQRRN